MSIFDKIFRNDSIRKDAAYNSAYNRGTGKDKNKQTRLIPHNLTPYQALEAYKSAGLIRAIVNTPARDATREWMHVKTGLDDHIDYNVNLGRKIENRLWELDFRSKLAQLIRYSRIYNEGGLMFSVLKENAPQTANTLSHPPKNGSKVLSFNVLSPENDFTYSVNTGSPLSSRHGEVEYSISGQYVNSKRVCALVNDFLPSSEKGIGVVEQVIDAVMAHESALWSINSLLPELSSKIFKGGKRLKAATEEQRAELQNNISYRISSQSTSVLDEDEELNRLNPDLTNIQPILDMIWTSASGLSRIPEKVLTGKAHGVVTAGQYDVLSYYSGIESYQKEELNQVVEWAVQLVLNESDTEVSQALNQVGITPDQLDWEIEWNPVWTLSSSDEAEISFKEAQKDNLYIKSGVLKAEEVREQKFHDLDNFS